MSSAPWSRPAPQASTDTGPAYTGMPGWVKWFAIAAMVLGVVLLVAKLVGGGEHGPGRHMSQAPPAETVFASAIRR